MSSYKIVVWKCTYLSKYALITPNAQYLRQDFDSVHLLIFPCKLEENLVCCVYVNYM